LPSVIGAVDSLASGIITAVNRLHATGAGLTLAGSLTGSTVVASPSAPLASAGLAVTPQSGTLGIGVFDSTGALLSIGTPAPDPTTMSLADLATALSAVPGVSASVSVGRLTLAAPNPPT